MTVTILADSAFGQGKIINRYKIDKYIMVLKSIRTVSKCQSRNRDKLNYFSVLQKRYNPIKY